MDVLLRWIQNVKNYIGVEAKRCCKDDDLKILVECFEHLNCIWANIYTGLDSLTRWQSDFHCVVGRFELEALVAVDQSLIHVQNDRFFV